MFSVPYTGDGWRIKAYVCFILSTRSVQFRTWYSATGLSPTDAVINMQCIGKAKHGVNIWLSTGRPAWVLNIVLMTIELQMQSVERLEAAARV